jgi:uncharacterized membrane-anchored protein
MASNWLTIKKRGLLLTIVVALQVIVLSSLLFSYYAVDWFGREIRLQTVPVDPRDIFYGDFVILNYEISNVPSTLWKGSSERPEEGDTVYVLLKPDTGSDVYKAVGVYPDKPSVQAEQAVLKARVIYGWEKEIRLHYGLERYYVPEGSGKKLEEQAADMIVRIKVAAWGQPRIVGLEY